MIYLTKSIFIIILIFSNNINANNLIKNNVIFKIDEDVYTLIDLERRIKYLEILNNIEIINTDNENRLNIIDDYVSSLIFEKYENKYNAYNNNLNIKIDNYLKEKFINNQKYKKLNENELVYIKDNIKIDLIRKKIIEDTLQQEKDSLLTKTNTLDLIYNYNISYLIVNKNKIDFDSLKKIENRKNFILFKNKLIDENISFFYKNDEIIDSGIISNFLKDIIVSKKKISIIDKNQYITIASLQKNLESYEGVFVKLINYKTQNLLKKNQLNCNYINGIDSKKIEFNEYEYLKLNNKIKENLKSINDYIYFLNDNIYNYIFLCELRYDEKILNNINFNKKVNNLAEVFQLKFIKKYKKKFNFKAIK